MSPNEHLLKITVMCRHSLLVTALNASYTRRNVHVEHQGI